MARGKGWRMIADWTVDAGLESPRIVVPWEGWVDLRCGTQTGTAARAEAAARARGLSEVQACPELGELLAAANTASMVTVKVDVFPVSHEEVDPEVFEVSWQMDESGALLEHTLTGFGSYLDVVLAAGLVPALPSAFLPAPTSALPSASLPGLSGLSGLSALLPALPTLLPGLSGLSAPPSEAFPYFEQVARSAVRILELAEYRLACAEIVVRPAQLYDRDTFGWTLYAIGFGADEIAARSAWAPAAASLVAALEQAIGETAESTGE